MAPPGNQAATENTNGVRASREEPTYSPSQSDVGLAEVVAELAMLGIEVAKSTVEKYQPKRAGPPSPTWRTFLDQHVRDLVSIDFFIVPTATFRVLFVFIVLAHDRRRRSLQRDGTPYGAVDGATDCRSVSV